jgi:hypothetical protein
MTKRNRKTLSDYFSKGYLPTQEAFGDLIESMVNIVDDGFEKSPLDGMKIAQLENSSKLVSFYDEITVKTPVWYIAFSVPEYDAAEKNNKNLNICYGEKNAAGMTFAAVQSETNGKKIRVGINNKNPKHEMDVHGVIASDGRIGREGRRENMVRADGEWHPIMTELDGCHAFEIMAGVGKPRSGRYALMHAFALNTFNPKKGSITYHQARYMTRCDQIELRWSGGRHDYSLEMRTRCSYENGVDEKIYVKYYVTQLWFDTFMKGCSNEGETK